LFDTGLSTPRPQEEVQPVEPRPVVVVVGNPKPKSRTLVVASEVADQVAALLGGESSRPQVVVIDVAELGSDLLCWGSPSVALAVERLRGASVAVVASPTYKATYTGVLKLFLDQVPTAGLAGTVAVPVMVGAASVHTLAVESLRAVLVELGASCSTGGLFVMESQLDELPSRVSTWLEGAAFGLSLARS
jgi:FMN reductase